MGSTFGSIATVSGLPYYVWEVPGKPISIHLPFDVIDRISPEVLRGFSALRRRGAEVGGILLGRWEDGPRRKVIIEDFEPVPSEYLTGPSYNLSENDLALFEAALAQRSGSDSGIGPVGFYRSHTRNELFMDDADLGLASRHFPGPENVFLLIKPFASRPSIGGFFFWEDGEIYRESSYLQFPFHRKELGGGETPRQEPPTPAESDSPSPPSPAFTPVVEQELVPFVPAAAPLRPIARRQSLSILTALETPPLKPSAWRGQLVPLFLVLAGAAGFFGYRSLKHADAPESPAGTRSALPLKLSVAEKQNQLEVAWDRGAPAIANAKRGVLSISDGSNRRDIELSGTQLRNGRVVYSRLSKDVNLRMEVFPEGRESVSESIRVVAADELKTAEPPASAARVAGKQASKKKAASKAAKISPPRPAPRPPSRPVSNPPAPERALEPPAPPPPAAPVEVELQRPAVRR